METQKQNYVTFMVSHRNGVTWGLIWLLLVLLMTRHQTLLGAVVASTTNLLPLMLIGWVMREWFIPRLLHRRRGVYYIVSFALLIVSVGLTVWADKTLYGTAFMQRIVRLPFDLVDHPEQGMLAKAMLHFKWTILILTTIAGTTVSKLIDERKELEQKAKENRMQSELKLLRAQINPHFLFNSLNCIYALTMTRDEKAPDSVLKLSEMLRYVIDDCNQEQVPLTKEAHYIENYIDFQRIRMDHEADISLVVRIDDNAATIPPMLFQPIVENCFKHSRIVDHTDAYVHLSLEQDGHSLTFTAENSKPNLSFHTADNERSGIGQQNVEQRLHFIFGERCTITTNDEPTKYKIQICIEY